MVLEELLPRGAARGGRGQRCAGVRSVGVEWRIFMRVGEAAGGAPPGAQRRPLRGSSGMLADPVLQRTLGRRKRGARCEKREMCPLVHVCSIVRAPRWCMSLCGQCARARVACFWMTLICTREKMRFQYFSPMRTTTGSDTLAALRSIVAVNLRELRCLRPSHPPRRRSSCDSYEEHLDPFGWAGESAQAYGLIRRWYSGAAEPQRADWPRPA